MRNLLKMITAMVSILFVFTGISAQERTVKMGTLVWDDTATVSLVTKKFLEKQGYTVELENFSEWGIAFAAMVRGDIDILNAHVNYVAVDYWARNHNQLEKISVPSHGLVQGLIVPSYMEINKIEELNSIRDQVGGRIIGIEPGAGLMRETADAVREYGLDYQIIDGSTPAMTAALKSAIERKEPIVTMLWEPSWMAHAFDFKYLEDPKRVFAPAQTYYWLGRKGYSAENPHLREAIASVFIPVTEVTRINADMNDGMSIDEAVDSWWERNQDLVDRWAVMSPAQ